jgi:hypothetical protein
MTYSIHALRAGALCLVAGALGLTACAAESGESVDTTTQAVSVHLKGGNNAKPSFFDGGFFLRSSGAVSGLGGGDVLVSLTAQANTTSTCTNQGGNQAPGQNPAPITVAGTQAIPATEVKNGNASFNVRTLDPVVSIPGAPDCPNGNWSEDLTDLQFTSATIEIEQGGVVVLTVVCSFSPPTSNGSVPGGNVTCTSS